MSNQHGTESVRPKCGISTFSTYSSLRFTFVGISNPVVVVKKLLRTRG